MGLLTASAAQNLEHVEPGVSPLAIRFGFVNRLEQAFNCPVVFVESSLLVCKKLFKLPAHRLKFTGQFAVGH